MNWRGAIFDMDGVLCDSERFICEAACRMFRDRHGVTATPADFVLFVGTGENRYLGGVAERYGVRLDLEADKAYTYRVYLEAIRGRMQPLPGVREFLDACRGRGLKLAVASSADEIKVRGNLAEIGLSADAFNACVNGSMVERKKPAPDLFLLAAQRAGVDPAACLVVEDAPSGIAAGRTAGCRTLGLTTSFAADVLAAAGADWTARDLAEAMSLLDTISRAFERSA